MIKRSPFDSPSFGVGTGQRLEPRTSTEHDTTRSSVLRQRFNLLTEHKLLFRPAVRARWIPRLNPMETLVYKIAIQEYAPVFGGLTGRPHPAVLVMEFGGQRPTCEPCILPIRRSLHRVLAASVESSAGPDMVEDVMNREACRVGLLVCIPVGVTPAGASLGAMVTSSSRSLHAALSAHGHCRTATRGP